MAITALTRNQMVGFSRHVGSNPTLSAKHNRPQKGRFYLALRVCGRKRWFATKQPRHNFTLSAGQKT